MNNTFNSPQKPPALLVFWVIWFAIFNGLFMLQFFAAGGFPTGENQSAAPVGLIAAAAGLVVASIAIRFLWIPKINDATKLLTAMIIGLALAEGGGFIGMFGVERDLPETRMALFVSAVSAVLAFAPVYAHRVCGADKMR